MRYRGWSGWLFPCPNSVRVEGIKNTVSEEIRNDLCLSTGSRLADTKNRRDNRADKRNSKYDENAPYEAFVASHELPNLVESRLWSGD